MSLDDTTLDLIRATLPVVGGAIDRITPIFYRRMFTARPELERDLFNRGNQQQGAQQKALAGAIAGDARLVTGDDPGRARPILSRIGHKHASAGITATGTRSSTATCSTPSTRCSPSSRPPRSSRPGTRCTGRWPTS